MLNFYEFPVQLHFTCEEQKGKYWRAAVRLAAARGSKAERNTLEPIHRPRGSAGQRGAARGGNKAVAAGRCSRGRREGLRGAAGLQAGPGARKESGPTAAGPPIAEVPLSSFTRCFYYYCHYYVVCWGFLLLLLLAVFRRCVFLGFLFCFVF